MASVTRSDIHLYSLTLQPPSAIRSAVVGNFAGGGTKDQLLLTAAGSRLTLYKIEEHMVDENYRGTLVEIHSQDTFSIIRSLGTYKISGSPKEYVVVGADTGKVATLEWMPEESRWQHFDSVSTLACGGKTYATRDDGKARRRYIHGTR